MAGLIGSREKAGEGVTIAIIARMRAIISVSSLESEVIDSSRLMMPAEP